MSASAQGFFASLVDQGLPCERSLALSLLRLTDVLFCAALFSMYITPQAVGNAELTLGGIDDTKFTGRLPR